MKKMMTAMALFLGLAAPLATHAEAPVVLELFTSQGCSSCPPADTLLQKLVEKDPSLVALSYHVDYWDRLGWKDTFSLPESTARQNDYASALGNSQVFTPQLIVNGTQSINGSDESAVRDAMKAARQNALPVQVAITPAAGQLSVSISPTATGKIDNADVWLVEYNHHAVTSVRNGENAHRDLETINNVTAIRKLGAWQPNAAAYKVSQPADRLAVIVQAPNFGKVYGAAIYSR